MKTTSELEMREFYDLLLDMMDDIYADKRANEKAVRENGYIYIPWNSGSFILEPPVLAINCLITQEYCFGEDSDIIERVRRSGREINVSGAFAYILAKGLAVAVRKYNGVASIPRQVMTEMVRWLACKEGRRQ